MTESLAENVGLVKPIAAVLQKMVWPTLTDAPGDMFCIETVGAAKTRLHSHCLWSMRKKGKQIDAELRGHGEYGWECQFLNDGELAYGRRWITRALALAEADDKRNELAQQGWTAVSSEDQSADCAK